jgi:hypothetical protein
VPLTRLSRHVVQQSPSRDAAVHTNCACTSSLHPRDEVARRETRSGIRDAEDLHLLLRCPHGTETIQIQRMPTSCWCCR